MKIWVDDDGKWRILIREKINFINKNFHQAHSLEIYQKSPIKPIKC